MKKGYSSGASYRRIVECKRSVSERSQSHNEIFAGKARLLVGTGRAPGS